jgi:hypothetical protein
MKTVPSELIYKDNKVIKKYDYNKYKENFENEIRIFEKFKSKYCVKIWNIIENGYTMERLKFSLGNGQGLNENNIRRILFSLSLDDLLKMLDNILLDLKKFGIHHRDLNPGNMLWSEQESLIKLTDLFWGKFEGQDIFIPDYANPLYGQDDSLAIERIKNDIKKIYNKIKPEIHQTLNEFQKVGASPYKDGSASSPGRSYHLVDIPDFKHIPYSKDTCIREYNLVKNIIIDINPRSFIDIGCASGYFTFNLLRDFRIDYAMAFEKDKEPLNFLKRIKSIYKLDELALNNQFDDTINLKKYDIAIWLNSHMWIYKQIGKKKTLEAVKNVIANTKYMFFQTAGGYSKGRYKIEEYTNKEDIKNMLLSCGAKSVKFIAMTSGIHNAPRDMFMVE